MINRVGVFLPINGINRRNISLKGLMTESENSVFFSIENNDSSLYTLNMFLKAVRGSQLDDAMAYVSKNYTDRIDLCGLSEVFESEMKICTDSIVKKRFYNYPKNCTAGTIMTVNGKKTKVFHIYMLNEPDKFGKWKIYSIEQE